VFTKVNEDNEELACSSLPSLPSVTAEGVHLLVSGGGTERRNFEPAAGGNTRITVLTVLEFLGPGDS
jgi:hypothetical protein